MKKSYALRSIAVMVMMMVATTAFPHIVAGNSQVTFNGVNVKKGITMVEAGQPQQAQFKAPKKVEGQVDLTISLVYDNTEFWASSIAGICDKNEAKTLYLSWSGTETVTSVAPGTYDIAVVFFKGMNPYYVIKEQVEVAENTTLTFSPTEAVNEIKFTHLRPDGTNFKLSLVEYDDEWNETVLEQGNTYTAAVRNFVFLKGVGQIAMSNIVMSMGGATEEASRIPNMEFHISNVSDRFTLVHMSQALGWDGEWYMSELSTNDINAGEIVTDVTRYNSTTETICYSPFGMEKEGIGFNTNLFMVYNGKLLDSGGIGLFNPAQNTEEQVTETIWNNAPYVDPNDENLQFLVGASNNDFLLDIEQSWGTQTIYYRTTIKPFNFVDGEKTYFSIAHVDENGEAWAPATVLSPSGKAQKQVMPTCAAFENVADRCQTVIGSTVPINALLVQNGGNLYGQWGSEGLRPFYVGRMGEIRLGDVPLAEIAATFNGETIEDITAWEGLEDGVYQVTYTSTNCEVDGLQGKNVTTITYDQSQDDATPPTITMLQFKNQEGIVTERFEKAEDATMVFTAVDFNQPEISAWNEPFDHDQPAEIKVEYAPYDSEEWVELPLDPNPTREAVHGWGYVYTLPLSEVDAPTSSGWFALRFTFADETGNRHEQVVSPAFRIAELIDNTGIERVDAQSNADMSVYDLQGRQVRTLSGLTPGIYIQGGKKIVVR